MAFYGKRAGGAEKKADASIRQRKAVRFDLESTDEKTGEFSGYAAVFGNVDDGCDVIEKGAFAKTIQADFGRIKILALHNGNWLPVGKPLELREDEHGLFMRGKISDTSMGRDIMTLLRDGVLGELSIGYDAVSFDYDSETGIRTLKEIKLWEVSIVTWAMNEQATIDDVKSMTEALKAEAASGQLTEAKANNLKPFLAAIRELVEVLSPLLAKPEPKPAPDPDPQEDPPEKSPAKDPAQKKSKSTGTVFEIVPTMNRR